VIAAGFGHTFGNEAFFGHETLQPTLKRACGKTQLLMAGEIAESRTRRLLRHRLKDGIEFGSRGLGGGIWHKSGGIVAELISAIYVGKWHISGGIVAE
jgi:hypothetical protein